MGSEIRPAPLRRVDVGEVSLAVTEQGAGELVVLLHGFPERAHTWRRQLRALADGGFRAAAPDMRGFGDSDRPPAVEAYRLERLVDDVAGLVTALGERRAHVVGHDWGGVVAWAVAALRPERVSSLTAMNAPPLAALHDELQAPDGGEQRMMAWYMLLYQFPGIAEELCARDDFAFLRARLARAPAGSFHAEDIEHFLAPLRSPGALTAGLNYYRALVPPSAWLEPPSASPPVTAPTLVLWGLEDRALHRGTLERSLAAAAGPLRVERLEGVGHYVQNEAPDLVNRHLLAFLAMHRGGPVDKASGVRTPPRAS